MDPHQFGNSTGAIAWDFLADGPVASMTLIGDVVVTANNVPTGVTGVLEVAQGGAASRSVTIVNSNIIQQVLPGGTTYTTRYFIMVGPTGNLNVISEFAAVIGTYSIPGDFATLQEFLNYCVGKIVDATVISRRGPNRRLQLKRNLQRLTHHPIQRHHPRYRGYLVCVSDPRRDHVQ